MTTAAEKSPPQQATVHVETQRRPNSCVTTVEGTIPSSAFAELDDYVQSKLEALFAEPLAEFRASPEWHAVQQLRARQEEIAEKLKQARQDRVAAEQVYAETLAYAGGDIEAAWLKLEQSRSRVAAAEQWAEEIGGWLARAEADAKSSLHAALLLVAEKERRESAKRVKRVEDSLARSLEQHVSALEHEHAFCWRLGIGPVVRDFGQLPDTEQDE